MSFSSDGARQRPVHRRSDQTAQIVSSTSRVPTGISTGVTSSQRELERGALVELGLGSHPTRVVTNDALDDRQGHSGTFVLLDPVHALKDAEQLAGVSHVEADAVVSYEVDDLPPFSLRPNLDQRDVTRAGELQRVR